MKKSELLEKAKPILFNADEVRAVLDGRKTQTRRVIKPQPVYHYDGILCFENDCSGDRCERCKRGEACPGREHSQWHDVGNNNWACRICGGEIAQFNGNSDIHAKHIKGDILWVRETWQEWGNNNYYYRTDSDCIAAHGVWISECPLGEKTTDVCQLCEYMSGNIKWRPSVHMSKEAARVFLCITDVRIERLQDISPEDCVAEGAVKKPHYMKWGGENHLAIHSRYKEEFCKFWDIINSKRNSGAYAWNKNPWVWVYDFKRVEVE